MVIRHAVVIVGSLRRRDEVDDSVLPSSPVDHGRAYNANLGHDTATPFVTAIARCLASTDYGYFPKLTTGIRIESVHAVVCGRDVEYVMVPSGHPHVSQVEGLRVHLAVNGEGSELAKGR